MYVCKIKLLLNRSSWFRCYIMLWSCLKKGYYTLQQPLWPGVIKQINHLCITLRFLLHSNKTLQKKTQYDMKENWPWKGVCVLNPILKNHHKWYWVNRFTATLPINHNPNKKHWWVMVSGFKTTFKLHFTFKFSITAIPINRSYPCLQSWQKAFFILYLF